MSATYHVVHHTKTETGDDGFPRVTLSGEAESGWVGEIHDGKDAVMHSPDGADFPSALENLLRHYERVKETVLGWAEGEQEKIEAAFETVYAAMVAKWHDLGGVPAPSDAPTPQVEPAPPSGVDAPTAEELNAEELGAIGSGAEPKPAA